MSAPEVIHQLVERFHEHKDAYHTPAYNEAQLRQEFLNPFFEAMGWDVFNMKDFAIQYREVIHEDSIHVKGSPNAKAPDYAFRLGGERKFFVEAKKPAEDIHNTREFAYQLKVYAWNLGLPLSILTDFEEFAVYDCRNKPNPTDSPAAARVMYVTYDQYLERWDEIAGIFSPQAIQKGAFDKYAADNTAKKGTTRVDDAFLAEIESWRTKLAQNIALRNKTLVENERQLNFAVQMTIDRIIFLRICEDRGIEPQNQLYEISSQKEICPRLVALYQRADTRYNSGLFHFKEEKGATNRVDSFTPSLSIDDKVLKDIIRSLYYPCPYVFKEIPVEILGQVYEQFLGKVIRLTPSHQAKIEEKPEVRKAGGVYYTPRYIVDYIVANTVGKLLEGKTPEQASRLKIVDPACGSGSFLLGAFQYLLDWHEQWYLANDPEKWTKGRNPALIQAAEGDWRLNTSEKKRILVNNIHGVDIDAQAVEVTKLSLLLKVLEEETGQLTLGFERALPDLGDNIKCGNSLIGWDYFAGQLMADEKEIERVNPFDWHKAFPEVFQQGGFDVVIGNPPYIRIQAMKEWAPGEVEFYKKKYISASKGNYDIYVVFVEKGLEILSSNGLLGFILPHKFFNSHYGESLRDVIRNRRNIERITYFGDQQVFNGATTYTCILILSASEKKEFHYDDVNNLTEWIESRKCESGMILIEEINKLEWNFFLGNKAKLVKKLDLSPLQLRDISKRIYQGMVTGADKIFLFKNWERKPDNVTSVLSMELNDWVLIENGLLKSVVRSGNIGRYWAKPTALVLYPYKLMDSSTPLLSHSEFAKLYPLGWNYLNRMKKFLESREKNSFKDSGWYRYSRNQNLGLWERQKLMIPYMVSRLSTYFDINDSFYFINVTTGGYGLLVNDNVDYRYLCGLLNSKLLNFYFMHISTTFHGGYFAAGKQFIDKLPIQLLDFTNPAEVKQHDHMVALVERMLALHKRNPQTPFEQEQLQREIAATDAQIDQLVYELYGLTDEQIRIVEGEGN